MPQDLPPQTAIINNTNQSGGTNIGILNNFAPASREITQAQVDAFKEAMSAVPNKENIDITSAEMGGETSEYASKLFQMLVASGFTKLCIGGVTPTATDWVGVIIVIKNPKNPPAITVPLVRAFKHAGIKCVAEYDPAMRDETKVMINVGKIEKP